MKYIFETKLKYSDGTTMNIKDIYGILDEHIFNTAVEANKNNFHFYKKYDKADIYKLADNNKNVYGLIWKNGK
jgi:hypothetical protein